VNITSAVKAEDNALATISSVQRELKKGLRKAGLLVARRARQLVPQPGYPGDKPELKPLRDTIGVEVKEGDVTLYAVIGPQRPAGAHGHLVEGAKPVRHHSHGRPTGVVLKPNPFLAPAVLTTAAAQKTAMLKALKAATRKAAK